MERERERERERGRKSSRHSVGPHHRATRSEANVWPVGAALQGTARNRRMDVRKIGVEKESEGYGTGEARDSGKERTWTGMDAAMGPKQPKESN